MNNKKSTGRDSHSAQYLHGLFGDDYEKFAAIVPNDAAAKWADPTRLDINEMFATIEALNLDFVAGSTAFMNAISKDVRAA